MGIAKVRTAGAESRPGVQQFRILSLRRAVLGSSCGPCQPARSPNARNYLLIGCLIIAVNSLLISVNCLLIVC